MCNFTPHRFTNWVYTTNEPSKTQPANKPSQYVSCPWFKHIKQNPPTNPSLTPCSKCPSPTTGALLLCITATRTGSVCAQSAQKRNPEQKRSGTCGACELVCAAAAEKKKLAEVKRVGGEGGEKVGAERSLPLRGRGTGSVRQSARLRDRGSGAPQNLPRR